jgi:hypothetical protein
MIKLVVPGVVPAAIPQYPNHVAPWKSYSDPDPGWYKLFSSMQYSITQKYWAPKGAGERAPPRPWEYELTPVVGRPVYTFDDWGDFIEASRQFTVDLFTKQFTRGISQYRCHIGPPRKHLIYRLPPSWTWRDEDDNASVHLP